MRESIIYAWLIIHPPRLLKRRGRFGRADFTCKNFAVNLASASALGENGEDSLCRESILWCLGMASASTIKAPRSVLA